MKQYLRKTKGFTLVEILVAITVLALVILIIAQITDSASNSMRLSNRMIDAASQARIVFGCMGQDFSNLVRRADMPLTAQNDPPGSGNVLSFVSAVASANASGNSSGNRNVSVVAYQISSSADNLGPDGASRPCLVRASKPIPWATTGYFGLDGSGLPVSFATASFPTSLVSQATDFDVLAPGVIRFAVGFRLYPDNQAVTLQDGTVIANAQGQVVYSPPMRSFTASGGGVVSVIDVSRIGAVMVGLVVIDRTNLRLLTSTEITALETKFPLPTNDTLPVPSWSATAESANALPMSVPLSARQALRVFECSYPVTPFGSRL